MDFLAGWPFYRCSFREVERGVAQVAPLFYFIKLVYTRSVMEKKNKKVFMAMSGGVDSSVAALLLKREGYDVVGCHFICWEGCDSNEDRRDAMRVAAKIDIPFHVFDFRKEYKERVFDYMIREYGAGRTPNPDVVCNSEIKFGIFLEKVLAMDADFVATGHYVRRRGNDLYTAKDASKDQSYFLWKLTPEQISRSLFPIGNYLKSEVREIAREAGLATAEKRDSQGLCFVGKVDFQDFIREYLPRKEGDVISAEGKILGKHDGAHFFTPGQRHGIRIGGSREPLYVAATDRENNTVLVAEGREASALYKKEIEISEFNLQENPPEKILARIRYRQPLQEARIMKHESGIRIIFDQPQRSAAPGQSVVFYLPAEASAKAGYEQKLLGGGVIS